MIKKPAKFRVQVFMVIFCFMLGGGLSPKAVAVEDGFDWSRDDHKLHLGVCYGFSLTSTLVMRKAKIPRWQAVLFSSLGTLALAYGKEMLLDPEYQRGDMIANSLGIATQALVVFSFKL